MVKIYLARNLRYLRSKQNKSQTAIAKELGLKRITYSKYEDGVNEPKLLTMLLISKYYEISVEQLLIKKLKLK